MDSSSFDEIFRRFQSVTGTSTQQELADVLGIKPVSYTHLGLIDAEQHGDAHQRADVEGQRQEDGNGHDARNAGDGPEHEPREDAEGYGPDGFRSEDGNEPCTDVREHVASPVVGLAEQDAGRKDDLHEVERHVIE